MVRIFRFTLFCLAAAALGSCAREEAGDGIIRFGVAPTVVTNETAQIGTRAKVGGSTFPSGAMIGLRVSAPSATLPLSPIYDHFFASFNGVTWQYYLDNVNAGDRLSGFSNWGPITVDSYFPYNAAVNDLTRIPFRIATLNGALAVGTESSVATDHMTAPRQSKNMSLPDPAGDLPLRFGHVMTAIELEVNRSISGAPILHLTDATFEITGGMPAREFTISGTYNAVNPNMADMTANIDPDETASALVVTYPSSQNLTSTSLNTILLVMMPELRYDSPADDATIKITFRFTDQDGAPYSFEDIAGGNPSVTFNLSDVVNASEGKGLLAGWSYTVKATLGYSTKFVAPTSGVPTVHDADLVDDPHNEFVDI